MPRSANVCTYIIIVIGDPLRGEYTNVGVILYDSEGNQIAAKVDTVDRAVHRGDLPSRCGWDERLRSFPSDFPTLESIKRFQSGTLMAMSRIRPHRGGTTEFSGDEIDILYRDFVAV